MNFEMSNGMIVTIVLGFMLFDVLIFVFIFLKRASRKTFSSEQSQYIHSHWIRIIDSFNYDPKNSIMDADKLLNYALEKRGVKGSTIGEKLQQQQAVSLFSDINNAWNAHKIRNRIAHELAEMDIEKLKTALQQFKKALNDLGAKL